MSCEQSRAHFFKHMSITGTVAAEDLETLYQQNRRKPGSEAERISAEAKTRLLFNAISAQGLKPPTHAADGLPKVESQPGYAAVYDLLRQKGMLGEHPLLEKAAPAKKETALFPVNDPTLGLDGRDAEGFDRWGYDRDGFNRFGFDREGFDKNGYNRHRFNRHGLDPYSQNAEGYGRDGFNAQGYDRNGFDKFGYSVREPRLDVDGYDRDGFDEDGYDRDGYDRKGRNRVGNPDPNFMPDANGMYPDGFDAHGYGLDGYDRDGYDRWGFGRDGYNLIGYDRNGYDRNGQLAQRAVDAQGYNTSGRKQQSNGRWIDRSGYDTWGYKDGRSFTGYDLDGKDASGAPRKVLNDKGKWVNAKYDVSGFDEDGYDQWGYHRDTGLTAADKRGRRYNTFGWVHDDGSGECYNPQDPTQRVKNEFLFNNPKKSKRKKVVSAPYCPSAPPPPITPFAAIDYAQYDAVNRYYDYPREKMAQYLSYTERVNMKPTVPWRRGSLDDKVKGGIRMRCPHCGQFTGGNAHACPGFNGQMVRSLRSGVVIDKNSRTLFSPHHPDFDPEYDNNGGYSSITGRDPDGYDMYGRNDRGYDREGYDRIGYDIFGYDRDGYDRNGYNNMGVNRRGEKRGTSLRDGQELAAEEGRDLLANDDLARMYGQIASGLIGKPRQVILREGGGFATDMKGKIFADPYPLGRDADPHHNLIVTRAGIYHELGHEQFTPQEIWARILEAAEGKTDVGLGEAARQMLPRFYNIVEDGRMEREVAAQYKGAAEILAASCRLEPRWGEEVGEGVSESDQVFWSLLYTGLPYFRVRQEVRNGMTPRARKVFEELEPVMMHAVRGTPEEAYEASVRIAKRFEEEGFIQLPKKDYSNQMPKPPGSGGGQPQQGQQGSGSSGQQQDQQGSGSSGQQQGQQSSSSSGQQGSGSSGQQQGTGSSGSGSKKEEEQKTGRRKAAKHEDEKKGRRSGEKKKDDPSTGRGGSGEMDGDEDPSGKGGSGAGSSDSSSGSNGSNEKADEFLFGNEVIDSAVRSVERDAAFAIENGMRARSKATTIGKPLHNSLPDSPAMSQRYRDASGMPKSVSVGLPKAFVSDELNERRPRHREVASMMTRPLKAIREQTELRLRRQSEGRLDRRQLVNAYKGMEDVYANTKEKPHTSFAASVQVDMSGSMHENISSRKLYDAVMTLGDCFDMLDMPFEVRAFGSSSAQVKSMRENFDPARAAYLAKGDLGGTSLADTAGLAHSALLASEETNKMMVCLSDGELNDHEESVRMLREARRNGLVTFGIYLGRNSNPAKMDELYGRGNWTSIQALSDMPKAVAQRLASIFKSMK